MEPLVSILIPAFNAERWVAQSIESGLNQSWKRLEIVVVDDGSTDGTYAAAQRWGSARVKVVRQANAGAAAARNRAYELCQGDYVQWLDADDILDAEKISRQMEEVVRIKNDRVVFTCTWGYFIGRRSAANFRPSCLWRDLFPIEWITGQLRDNAFMANSCFLVSRRITEEAGPWDKRLSYNDDGEYFNRIVLASDHVKFVSGAKVYYRMAVPNSLSQVELSSSKLDSLMLSTELQIKRSLAKFDQREICEAGVALLQQVLPTVFPERPDLVQRAIRLAGALGGELRPPQMPLKYAWIERAFGPRMAKRSRWLYNDLKWRILRGWEGLVGGAD